MRTVLQSGASAVTDPIASRVRVKSISPVKPDGTSATVCLAVLQTATSVKGSGLIAVFEVANRKGIWIPAMGSVESVSADGIATVLVTPQGHAASVSNDWLASVRYAMVDEPQCVLYSAASLPALPFELPVPWERP